VFYSTDISLPYLAGALGMFAALRVSGRFRIMSLVPYLIGGTVMWYLMLRSGVHATIAGVLLAFTIPFSALRDDAKSPSHRLEHWLHKPVAFGVLPIFALANTGVLIGASWADELTTANGLGILGGLIVGKPVGILLACALAVSLGLCRLPSDLRWSQVLGAGMLGGIGFTMSIFIANLAFPADAATINASKMAILGASLTAGILGYAYLRVVPKKGSDPNC
jgi:NhaA family Na+:H+ antiporter